MAEGTGVQPVLGTSPGIRFQGGPVRRSGSPPEIEVVIKWMPDDRTLAVRLLEKFQNDREKMERYSAVCELCPIPVFIVAHDGSSVIYINPAYRRLTGRAIDELQNNGWLSVIHPDDRDRVETEWTRFLKTEISKPSLRRYIHVDGTTTEAQMTVQRVERNGYVGFIVPTDFNNLVSPAGIPPAP